MIWSNAVNNWHFGRGTSGLTVGHPDFLTTAIHEIGHILGYGEVDSWFAQTNNGYSSVAAHGGAVPLDQYDGHWATGTMSTYNGIAQETLMDPSTRIGDCELPTILDYAVFSDIGWQVQVSAVPETGGMMIIAFRLLYLTLRNHPS